MFSQTDLDVLEYFDDLKSYWIKGILYSLDQ